MLMRGSRRVLMRGSRRVRHDVHEAIVLVGLHRVVVVALERQGMEHTHGILGKRGLER